MTVHSDYVIMHMEVLRDSREPVPRIGSVNPSSNTVFVFGRLIYCMKKVQILLCRM